jgi:hypothetical protein
MEPAVLFIIRICNWSRRQYLASRATRKGLIVWLLPMVAVFALAPVSGGQETTPGPNDPPVVEETDNPNDNLNKDIPGKDDLDKDDQDIDDLGKDKKSKDKKNPLDDTTYSNPTTSSPIALSADNTLLWVVNPTDNSVSVIRTDSKHVLTTIKSLRFTIPIQTTSRPP